MAPHASPNRFRSFLRNVLSLPITYCGNRGCISRSLQIMAIYVRHFLRSFFARRWTTGGELSPRLPNTLPLPWLSKQRMHVSSKFTTNNFFPAAFHCSKRLNNCQAASACEAKTICNAWTFHQRPGSQKSKQTRNLPSFSHMASVCPEACQNKGTRGNPKNGHRKHQQMKEDMSNAKGKTK